MRATLSRSLTAAVCGLVLVLFVSSVFAQDSPPGGRRGMRGPGMGGPGMGGPGMGGSGMRGQGMGGPMGGLGSFGVIQLLGIEQVQKEINLTEDQKAQLEKFRQGLREEMQKVMEEFRDLGPEERRQKFEQSREKFLQQAEQREKDAAAKLADILQPEQLKRVKQIQLQQAGAAVLRSPVVAEQLSLTEDQKTQLKKIQDEAFEQMRKAREARRAEGGGDRPEGQPRPPRGDRNQMRQRRAEIEKKCMAVLTPEQKAKLAEMMGQPFELDRSALRGGWGGQDGPRPEGRRGEGRRRGPRRGNDQPQEEDAGPDQQI